MRNGVLRKLIAVNVDGQICGQLLHRQLCKLVDYTLHGLLDKFVRADVLARLMRVIAHSVQFLAVNQARDCGDGFNVERLLQYCITVLRLALTSSTRVVVSEASTRIGNAKGTESRCHLQKATFAARIHLDMYTF